MKKTITDLHQNFTQSIESLKLEKENQALHETVDKLTKEIDRLREMSKSPSSKLIKINVTPEEEILDQQICFLQMASRIRLLEINEAKMLDLYIKNKRLIQEKSTMNADFSTLAVNKMSDEELLQLVESGNTDVKENKDAVGSGESPLE